LPSKSEYEALDKAVGGANVSGKKLKAKSGWNKNGNGTDEFGFSALPGGRTLTDGSFYDVGNNGFWWGVSDGGSYAYYRNMAYYGISTWTSDDKSNLQSVRCIKD
jgi:uncharacterized protein (TIGR02145 family)